MNWLTQKEIFINGYNLRNKTISEILLDSLLTILITVDVLVVVGCFYLLMASFFSF